VCPLAVCKYGAKSLVKARLILLKQSLSALWVKDKLVELFARMVGMQVSRCLLLLCVTVSLCHCTVSISETVVCAKKCVFFATFHALPCSLTPAPRLACHVWCGEQTPEIESDELVFILNGISFAISDRKLTKDKVVVQWILLGAVPIPLLSKCFVVLKPRLPLFSSRLPEPLLHRLNSCCILLYPSSTENVGEGH
jgi:hypothetical protein